MAETTTTQISDLPEYQKQYLQEIMQRAQALGKQAYTLPSYQTAGRTPIQQQATNLATQGIGSYMPMLQAGEQATGAGIAATESLLDPNAAMAYISHRCRDCRNRELVRSECCDGVYESIQSGCC